MQLGRVGSRGAGCLDERVELGRVGAQGCIPDLLSKGSEGVLPGAAVVAEGVGFEDVELMEKELPRV
jgi:hypothetical protein